MLGCFTRNAVVTADTILSRRRHGAGLRAGRPAAQGLEGRRLLSAAGLNYAYYEGTWSTLPNFATLTPVKTGLTHNVDPSIRNRDANYAFKWQGNLSVGTAGTYTFYSASHDGSEVLIDGVPVVNNDGTHAYAETSGTAGLSAGTHAITVERFQTSGDQRLAVSYQGPGVPKQAIPDAALTGVAPGNVFVHNYGAVGDGTTNDSPAIQSAINAAPDGATLVLDAGKTYRLNSGLAMARPLNVEGNGATLLLNTSAYPQNETVYYASPVAAASYTWKQTATAGQTTYSVPVSTTALEPGDTVFLQLGTDPNDSTEPNWAEVCQVTANTGTSVTVNVPVPYATVQGSLPNRIQRLTDVVQNVAFKDVNFDYVNGTTPDTNLWLNMARNVTVANLTGRFTIMANVTDSQNVTVTGCSGTLNQLTSSGGRLVSAWQTDGLHVTNNTATTAADAPAVLLESWCRNTTITGLTVNWNDPDPSTQDVFHFTGNSYNTFADGVVVNNVGAVNLVLTGTQAASYAFGTVTINGPVRSAPLPAVAKLVTGGQTYDASRLTTSTFTVPVSANWNDYQVALGSGVVETISYTLSSLTGVNGLFVTNSNGNGSQLAGTLNAGQTTTLPQFFGTDYAFNTPSAPVKTLSFYTGSNVPAGTTLTVTASYYAGTADYLRLDPDGRDLDVWYGTAPTRTPAYTQPLAGLTTLSLSPTVSGAATVTVDFANGDPLPSGGLTVLGNAGVSSVGLTVLGTGGSDAVSVDGTTVRVGSDPAITYAGLSGITANGNGGADTITQSAQPAAPLVLAGNTATDALVVNGGTFTVPAPATGGGVASYPLAALAVGSAGRFVLASAATAPADRTLLRAAAITGGGTVDVGRNDVDLTGTTLAAVTRLARAGYAGGTWTGTGLVSAAASSDATHLTAVGVTPNVAADGSALYPTFDGQPAAATDVLIRATYYGDANLDGHVDAADYARIDAGFLNHSTAGGWGVGDFNYDGVVDGSDYTLIDNAFNMQGGPLVSTAAVAAPVTLRAALVPVAATPKPAAAVRVASRRPNGPVISPPVPPTYAAPQAAVPTIAWPTLKRLSSDIDGLR